MNFQRTIRKFAPGLLIIILLLAGLRVWTWMTLPYGVFQEAGFEDSKDVYARIGFPRKDYSLVTPDGIFLQGHCYKENGEWFLYLDNMTMSTPTKWRLEISLMELRAFKIEPLPTTNFVLKRLFFTPTLSKPAKQ